VGAFAAELEDALLRMAGVEKRSSRFARDRIAFFVKGKEFLHFHGPLEIDVRVGRVAIRQHRDIWGVDRRIALESADWIVFRAARRGDLPDALALAEIARRATGRGSRTR
jgi:hypothetical protein